MIIAELFKNQKNEVNDELVKHDQKLKKMHFYKEQLAQQIDKHRIEMKSEWNICTEEILDKLQVQENRMQDIEIRHLAVLEFQKKFSEFQIKVFEVIELLDTVKDIPRFVERTIPVLTHLQISEAL